MPIFPDLYKRLAKILECQLHNTGIKVLDAVSFGGRSNLDV